MGGKSNPITDIVNSVFKGIDDTFVEGGKVLGGDINIDPFTKQKEEAKEEGRDDAKQRAAASKQQEIDKQNQLKVRAANRDAGEGSSIILGGKQKKKKGSSVSSGMGLSKGDTGLQV